MKCFKVLFTAVLALSTSAAFAQNYDDRSGNDFGANDFSNFSGTGTWSSSGSTASKTQSTTTQRRYNSNSNYRRNSNRQRQSSSSRRSYNFGTGYTGQPYNPNGTTPSFSRLYQIDYLIYRTSGGYDSSQSSVDGRNAQDAVRKLRERFSSNPNVSGIEIRSIKDITSY